MRQTVPTPGASGRARRPGEDVRREDGAARARAAERLDVHTALGGQSPCLRRRSGEPRRGPVDGGRLPLARDVGEHVGLLDLAAGRLDLGEIDAVLLGDLAGEGRGPDRRRRRRDDVDAGGRLPRRDGRRLLGGEDQRDRLSDGDHVARSRGHVSEDARDWRLDLGGGLVGLDLHERLALPHLVAGGLEPVQDLAGLLRQLQRRHDDVRGHQRITLSRRGPSPPPRPSFPRAPSGPRVPARTAPEHPWPRSA